MCTKEEFMKNTLLPCFLSRVCLMTYRISGNQFLSSKMPNKHNTRSQPNLGVLQTSVLACAPLLRHKFKLSKRTMSLKNMNITEKHWVTLNALQIVNYL